MAARRYGRAVGADALLDVFAREAGDDLISVRDQMAVGGLCWTLITLRWIVEEGAHAVADSASWIDELVTDARSFAALPPG